MPANALLFICELAVFNGTEFTKNETDVLMLLITPGKTGPVYGII